MPALGQTIVESQAIAEDHFPSRQYCFVWRNWELVNSERMAAVLGCGVREVEALGVSMGLPRKQRISDDQLRRVYITVIRQNWHLLPVEQLVDDLVTLDGRVNLPPSSGRPPAAPWVAATSRKSICLSIRPPRYIP